MTHSQITWYIKNQENEAHSQEKREWTTSDPEIKQMLNLTDKKVKAAILTMFKNAKANMLGFLSQGKKKKNYKRNANSRSEK